MPGDFCPHPSVLPTASLLEAGFPAPTRPLRDARSRTFSSLHRALLAVFSNIPIGSGFTRYFASRAVPDTARQDGVGTW